MSNTWLDEFRTGDVMSLGEFSDAGISPRDHRNIREYAEEVYGIDYLDGDASVLARFGTDATCDRGDDMPRDRCIGLELMISGEHDDGTDDLPKRFGTVAVEWPYNERATLIRRVSK